MIFIDLTGERFHRLLVLSFSHKRNNIYYWNCRCDCGVEKIIDSGSLKKKTNPTKSCGCLNRETGKEWGPKNGRKSVKDITGETFGRLLVQCDSGKRTSRGEVIWECLCKCGNVCFVSSPHLRRNEHTTSCGCRSRQQSKLYESTKRALSNLKVEIYKEEFPIHQEPFAFTNKKSILYVDIMVWSSQRNSLIAIECQGEQHYKPVDWWGGEEIYRDIVERDTRKRSCLALMNIPLIEIRYDEPNIEEFLKQKLEL